MILSKISYLYEWYYRIIDLVDIIIFNRKWVDKYNQMAHAQFPAPNAMKRCPH